MASLAVDRRDFVWVWIGLDVRMAARALQAAVNARAEFLAVDGDAVAGAVGHGGIAVAGKAVSLRAKSDGRECDGENGNADSEDSVANSRSCSFPCGAVHPAVFFPQAKEDSPRLYLVLFTDKSATARSGTALAAEVTPQRCAFEGDAGSDRCHRGGDTDHKLKKSEFKQAKGLPILADRRVFRPGPPTPPTPQRARPFPAASR